MKSPFNPIKYGFSYGFPMLFLWFSYGFPIKKTIAIGSARRRNSLSAGRVTMMPPARSYMGNFSTGGSDLLKIVVRIPIIVVSNISQYYSNNVYVVIDMYDLCCDIYIYPLVN
jgi:hypothetical protein